MDLQAIIGFVTQWVPVLTAVIAVAAAIAAITPSRNDDRVIQFILDIINKFGLNIAKAKNADDV